MNNVKLVIILNSLFKENAFIPYIEVWHWKKKNNYKKKIVFYIKKYAMGYSKKLGS